MFGKESLCDYSESCCRQLWKGSFLYRGCHSLSLVSNFHHWLPSAQHWAAFPAPGCCCSPSLCAAPAALVFLDHQSSCLAAGPAWGQGLVPKMGRLASLRAHCWCHLQQQGKGWARRAQLPPLAALWALSQTAGKLHSSRDLCKMMF